MAMKKHALVDMIVNQGLDPKAHHKELDSRGKLKASQIPRHAPVLGPVDMKESVLSIEKQPILTEEENRPLLVEDVPREKKVAHVIKTVISHQTPAPKKIEPVVVTKSDKTPKPV